MKIIIILCVVITLCGCLKVQKKTDLDKRGEEVVVVAAEPVVYVLDEIKFLTEDTLITADEVYLKSNARIFTNQFALNIQAKSIYVDSGVFIQTFPDQQLVAPMEAVGLDGGVVHIIVNDIHGHLKVLMNGQQGGRGLGGWNGLPAKFLEMQDSGAFHPCMPNGGKNSGVSGSFFLEVNQTQDFSMTTSMKVAPAGETGDIAESPIGLIRDPEIAKKYKIAQKQNCRVPPVIGKAGITGQICLKILASGLTQCERF